ncbi:MAG: DUF4097 family beta strand repeat-containing protein [Acidobacteriota bacterium]
MRNVGARGASQEMMTQHRTHSSIGFREASSRYSSRRNPLAGPGPWIAVALGLLLMLLAAISRGDDTAATARRTERFTATLTPRSTVRVENVSGDVIATAGREFSAICNITVTASTQKRADEVLGGTHTVQAREGDELSLEARWPENGKGRWDRSEWTFRGRNASRCRDCRISMRYELVIPPGVSAILRTVNGEVRVQEVDGKLDVQSVNGNVTVRGSRRDVRAQTVNGRVEVAAQAAPAGSDFELKTVSGGVTLTLPKETRFDLTASTMNGSIDSTFALPARSMEASDLPSSTAPRERVRVRTPRRVVVDRRGDETVVDVEELQKELDEAMRDVDIQVREVERDVASLPRKMNIMIPGGEYRYSSGEGASVRVRLSSLNGRIALLAAGTKESDAKPLVARRSFVVTVPRAPRAPRAPESPRAVSPRPETWVVVPQPPAPLQPVISTPPVSPAAIAPLPPSDPADEDGVIHRGDVSGDFISTAGGGTYEVGRVSGSVTILTRSGEIHVGGCGSRADLKTYGGDIVIGPVTGDLKAQTLAGDIRAGAVGGSVFVETSGGDIRVAHVGGSADARTAGGDIILPAVAGGVRAESGGGEIRIAITAREARTGIAVRNSGGDVTLTLPGNFRGEFDLTATEVDSDESAIRADFPEIVVTRKASSQHATGTVNGGGPKVTVRTSSGSIRIRRGPSASS